jgi:hypothetical protein
VRSEIGGVVDPNKSNLELAAKIVTLQTNLPIYYTNENGKEVRPSKHLKFRGFIHAMNPNARMELGKWIKSNSSKDS